MPIPGGMTTREVQLREIYPDAASRARGTITIPPQTLVHARRWSRIAAFFLTIGGLTGLASWEFLKSGDSGVFVALCLLVTIVFLPIGAVVFWVPRRLMRLPEVDEASVRWDAWAGERGFTQASPEVEERGRRTWPWSDDGKGHQWPATYTGRVGDVEMVVGAVRWRTGEEGDSSKVSAIYAQVVLGDFWRMFVQCSMTRYLRGIDCVDPEIRGGRRLRTESSMFDNTCNVRVDEGVDPVVWHELFDPVTIDGLQREYDVQWRVSHGLLTAVCDAGDPDRVSPSGLDTMCRGLAWMHDRLHSAAKGDMSSAQTSPASRTVA